MRSIFHLKATTPARDRGVRILNPEELQKGDISMEIVSKRMNRSYSKTEKSEKSSSPFFIWSITATR